MCTKCRTHLFKVYMYKKYGKDSVIVLVTIAITLSIFLKFIVPLMRRSHLHGNLRTSKGTSEKNVIMGAKCR